MGNSISGSMGMEGTGMVGIKNKVPTLPSREMWALGLALHGLQERRGNFWPLRVMLGHWKPGDTLIIPRIESLKVSNG